MQGFDIEALKLQWAQVISDKPNVSLMVKNMLLKKIGYIFFKGKLEKKSTPGEDKDIENGLGSTTLIVGKLEGSHIKMAYAGDGGFIIANSDRVKAFGGQHAEVKAPAQLRLAGGKIDINQVQYFDIELSKGDTVLVYSDGLYCTAIGGEVSSEFRAKQVVSLIRSGNSVEQIVKSLTSDAAGGDDIEVLAFKYGG
jgi:serine/threonine protein phosphatase PrpC